MTLFETLRLGSNKLAFSKDFTSLESLIRHFYTQNKKRFKDTPEDTVKSITINEVVVFLLRNSYEYGHLVDLSEYFRGQMLNAEKGEIEDTEPPIMEEGEPVYTLKTKGQSDDIANRVIEIVTDTMSNMNFSGENTKLKKVMAKINLSGNPVIE